MSQVTIQGNVSGSGVFTIASPNSNNSRTLNLPDATGTAVLDSATQTLTNKTLTSPTITTPAITGGTAVGTQVQGGSLTQATSQASTSGTFIDFTGIPAWVKRITVLLNEVSSSGTSIVIVRVGAGSVATSGYTSTGVTWSAGGAAAINGYSAGFLTGFDGSASYVRTGILVLANLTGNTWVLSGSLSDAATTRTSKADGLVNLGGVLDRVRITTINGTDTFDAGSINILYEG